MASEQRIEVVVPSGEGVFDLTEDSTDFGVGYGEHAIDDGRDP